MDNFKFLVKDSKPNVVSDNVFHIQWSLISFEHRRLSPFLSVRLAKRLRDGRVTHNSCSRSYNVSEKAGTVAVTVKRTGNLNQYAVVLCRTEQGSATSSSSVGTRPGQQDYVEYAGQVTHASALMMGSTLHHRPGPLPFPAFLHLDSVSPHPPGPVRRARGHQGVHHHRQRRQSVRGGRELPGGAEHARVRPAGGDHPRRRPHQRHRGRAHAAVRQEDVPRQREQRPRPHPHREKRHGRQPR